MICIKKMRVYSTVLNQVNLFKEGLGVGVPGNQHDKRYAQGEIQRQIVCAIKYYVA